MKGSRSQLARSIGAILFLQVVLWTIFEPRMPLAKADWGDEWVQGYAVNHTYANYTGLAATFRVPGSGSNLPSGSSGACINHVMWIIYPTFDHWLEMGIQHCPGHAANTYSVYQFSGIHGWGPSPMLVTSGSDVRLEMYKISSTRWVMKINGSYVADQNGSFWPPADSAYNTAISGFDTGLESQSVTYKATSSWIREIKVQTSIGGQWVSPNQWNPWNDQGRRYYISGNATSQYPWGDGLPSRTGWVGSASGIGSRYTQSTQLGAERQAERFAGHKGIDVFQTITSLDGLTKGYAIGWHGGDTIEYVMQFPYTSNPRIWAVGLSDKPGPVLANVYIDAQYVGQMYLNHNDNNHHLFGPTPLVAQMPNSFWAGAHSLALEFANDYCNGNPCPPDQDRNFYLDAVGVTAQ